MRWTRIAPWDWRVWGREEKHGELVAVSEGTFGRARRPPRRRFKIRGWETEREVRRSEFGGASAISEVRA